MEIGYKLASEEHGPNELVLLSLPGVPVSLILVLFLLAPGTN